MASSLVRGMLTTTKAPLVGRAGLPVPPSTFKHVPVLLSQVATALGDGAMSGVPKTLVDATIGLGGHAIHLLQQFPTLRSLVGIDRDMEALQQCSERLGERFPSAHIEIISNRTGDGSYKSGRTPSDQRRIVLIHDSFENLDLAMERADAHQADCMLMDLGVSSLQLDKPDRGFSFRHDGPLDMRMDRSPGSVSALDLISKSTVESLSDIIQRFGEERWADRIAQRVMDSYAKGELNTTFDLERICWEAYPAASRTRQRTSPVRKRPPIHPATRTFMALRLAVNNELSQLENVLKKIATRSLISPNGRLAVISFHSLEDRIVKHTFRAWKKSGNPCEIITKRPIKTDEIESASNPRSRSAKLRVLSWT